ncbi:MAG: AraC family transcriptional regulator [Cryobacterium sp.]|nr:AraC family transcriptional regulator [Cryobacterium sp.]
MKRDALVQFDGDWLAQCTALMPELGDLAPLLRRSRQGLVFHGETAIALAEAIEGMGEQSGIDRLYELVGIFRVLARAPEQDVECLDAEYSRLETESRFADAVDVGIDYIFRNLTKVVVLGEAARLAHMSESTFSRYFKRASGLTFTDMVSKLRISHACRLLETTDDPVSAISHAVGFSNLSNFNRAFLRDIGNTPSGYRKTSPRRGLPTSAVSFDPAVMR